MDARARYEAILEQLTFEYHLPTREALRGELFALVLEIVGRDAAPPVTASRPSLSASRS